MKKSMRTIACMALASIALTACNNQTSKVDEAPAATKTTTEGVKIAYVEVDSIMTQYKFCKEYSAILEKKSQNIQNTVNAKGRALQNAAAKHQGTVMAWTTIMAIIGIVMVVLGVFVALDVLLEFGCRILQCTPFGIYRVLDVLALLFQNG